MVQQVIDSPSSTGASLQSLSSVEVPTQASNQNVSNDIINSIANIAMFDKYKGLVGQKINAPFNVETPKEKVKKRPDGFDYVEGTWMDHVAKETMPLYEYNLLHISWDFGWVSMVVSLTDRVSGNIELGAGAARIQVRQGVETPGFRDVIDMGNNVKAALTQAIKNAQSRFGVSADVYGKRESMPTDDERKQFQEMTTQIKAVSSSKAKIFQEQWDALGTDYSEFLDRWRVFVENNSSTKTDTKPTGQLQSVDQVEVKQKSMDKPKIKLDL